MTDLPRVALLAHRFAPDDLTGIGRYYVEIAKALAELEPRTVTYEIASPAEPDRPAWLPGSLTHRQVRGQRQALLLAWCLAQRPLLDARTGNPDLVHLLHPWVPTPTRAPLVATVHDLMPILHPEWYGRRERWAYGRGAEFVAERAERIVAISDLVAAQLVEHLDVERARIEVVYNGIDDRFRSAPSPDSAEVARIAARYGVSPGRYLVALGKVSDRKNLTPLFAALARIERLAPAPMYDLVVAGPPGKGADRVLARAEASGVSERVNFAGFVDDADLPALLAGALALVHPSLDEGFGLTPLEAMAAGTVAIASTAGSLPEVMGAAGILVDPSDGDAWASAVAAVATDPEARQAHLEAGRQRAARFTWEANAERLRAIHLDLMGRQTTEKENLTG